MFHRLGGAGNLAVSPASVALALAMASAGARGETLSEMRTALSHTLDLARQHAALGALERRWQGLQGAGLRVASANRLFGSRSVPFAPEFVDWMKSVYRAPLEQLDFSEPDAAAARVNEWISSRTARRIREAVTPEAFGARNGLVLANALYFRARWKDEFSREATRQRPFWVGGTQRVQTPTMAMEGDYAYARRRGTLVVELPYLGGGFSMFVLLPRARDGIAATERECLRPSLDQCLRGLTGTYLDLRLPRFRIETDALPLKPVLQNLGMTRAFTAGLADFSAMAPAAQQLFIGGVAQKVFVAVDEKGTEAAAATVAVYGVGDIPPKPVPFHVDHPFIFLIRDRVSGVVLFVGRVSDPR